MTAVALQATARIGRADLEDGMAARRAAAVPAAR
jgi:hypothetical protein